PRLKGIDRLHGIIDARPEIQTLNRRILELPMRAVKGKPVIDHLGEEAGARGSLPFQRSPGFSTGTEEYGLPGIRVANPLVEDQCAQKVRAVFDLLEESIGQEIKDGYA